MTQNTVIDKKTTYDKYLPKNRSFLSGFVKGNAVMFLLGSLAWVYFSHQPSYEPEMRDYTGPVMDDRTYIQAIKDAYTPFYNGKYDPHVTWFMNIAMQIILALVCAGIYARSKAKRNAAAHDIDIMLELDKLASQHNMDAAVARKMLDVAPQIVKKMSADSRVYFDMIMDGKISLNDERFINTAIAVMVGHLQSHPEDIKQIMELFDERSIPPEILKMTKLQARD